MEALALRQLAFLIKTPSQGEYDLPSNSAATLTMCPLYVGQAKFASPFIHNDTHINSLLL